MVSEWMVIGRFGRPHGVKGLIHVYSFTEPIDNILNYSNWHVNLDKIWKPIDVLSVQMNNKAILIKLNAYDTREQVASLTNADIAIHRSQRPGLNSDEYYWDELIGMTVFNQNGVMLGEIKSIMPTGANDVLVVEGTKRFLIPYLLNRFILSVDVSQQRMLVNWDENF